MADQTDIIVAIANPQLRRKILEKLQAGGTQVHVPRDLEDLTRLLLEGEQLSTKHRAVLALDEAFIYPHVYEECERIKLASPAPLTILLLVEPRTRTRADWMGADRILRLPMSADRIAASVVAALAALP